MKKKVFDNQAPKREYVEGQLIVKFKSGIDRTQAIKDFKNQFDLTVIDTLGPQGDSEQQSYVFQSSTRKVVDLEPAVKKDPRVEYAEPNFKMFLFQGGQ